MRLKPFDQRLGAGFLETVPTAAGVYRVYDSANILIYVGMAKNLRRRLSQYRNAKRLKRHHKMRTIISAAARIEHEICADPLAAGLEENRLIQKFRPRLNIAGAFSFMYPLVGWRKEKSTLYICYTTSPDKFPEYRLHGAYRSRKRTRDMFFALTKLLSLLGHAETTSALVDNDRDRYSMVRGFRQLSAPYLEGLPATLDDFFEGKSYLFIEKTILALLERASARYQKDIVQEAVRDLKRFYKHESKPLAQARAVAKFADYPVPQDQRDQIFLKYRDTP